MAVGDRSFTSALIEELQAFGKMPFTVAMLHSRLVTMRWRLKYTPIYALLSEHGGHSIELGALPNHVGSSSQPSSNDVIMGDSIPTEPSSVSIQPSMPSQESTSSTAADARVLLAVSITGDAVLDVSQWKTWLTTQAPWDVAKVDVTVEAVYDSNSTLLLASVPIFAWDSLGKNSAYRFVGFIKSANLEQLRSGPRLAAEESTKQEGAPSRGPTRPIGTRRLGAAESIPSSARNRGSLQESNLEVPTVDDLIASIFSGKGTIAHFAETERVADNASPEPPWSSEPALMFEESKDQGQCKIWRPST